MNYAIKYSEEYVAQPGRLEKKTARRIIKKPEGVMQNPNLFFERLSGRPERTLMVGDYRIIANIDNKNTPYS